MRAKEYFEGVRGQAVALARAQETLERMKAREGARTQSYQAGAGGEGADPMESVQRRIDFEHRLGDRIAAARAAVDEACEVLYGTDGRGGLAKLKGTRYADAICMAYCQAEPWNEIADALGSSPQWCRSLCRAGFVFIDRVGWAKVKNA